MRLASLFRGTWSGLAAIALLAAGEVAAQGADSSRTVAYLTPAVAEVAAVEAAYAAHDRNWSRLCDNLDPVRLSGDARGLYVLADCLFRRGQIDEAVARLRVAVAADPAALHAWAAVQMYLDLARAPAPPRRFSVGDLKCEVLKPSKKGDSPVVTPPTLEQAAQPFYPSVARFMKKTGKVVVDLCLGGDGRVTAAEVAESSGRLDFDALALVTALESRFTPATVGGQPASSLVRIPVRLFLN